MNLVIDIGNTSVKAALFSGMVMIEAHVQLSELDELLQKNKVEQAIVSRSGQNHDADELLRQYKVPVTHLHSLTPLPISIAYRTPETLGADRLAGSVGANALFPDQNVLKIDFGTCITYDFISEKNVFEGGGISPGMMLRFKAMHNYTARLPLIDPMRFPSYGLVGNDTAHAMVSGVMNGIKSEVDGIINEYKSRFNGLKVVVTGGDAGLFATLLKSEIFARPYLVLEGLNTILNYNK